MKSSRLFATFPAILATCFVANSSFADVPSDAPAPLSGVWQQHKYTFQFMGFTTTYSCDGLASKLKVLLRAAGARSDVKSFGGACSIGSGSPDKFARAYLTFYTLAPPGTEGVQGPPVNAQWKEVKFADRSPRELAIGDCELVDLFNTSVLPMFTTRNLINQTTCVPRQNSGSVINLTFESLAEVPATKSKATH